MAIQELKKKKNKATEDYYIIDGIKYNRVTRILDIISKPEFYRWYGKYGFDYCQNHMENRATFGTMAHKNIERILNGEDVDIYSVGREMSDTLQRFMTWAADNSLQPIYLEKQLVDDDLMIAGTADFIGYYNNDFVLIDWKTSSRLYDEQYLQLSAYIKMFEKLTYKDSIKYGMIVNIKPDKIKVAKIDLDDADYLFNIFCSALNVYRWKRDRSWLKGAKKKYDGK